MHYERSMFSIDKIGHRHVAHVARTTVPLQRFESADEAGQAVVPGGIAMNIGVFLDLVKFTAGSTLCSATTLPRAVHRRSPAGRRWARTLLSGFARQGSHEAHRFADETLGSNTHFIDVVIFK